MKTLGVLFILWKATIMQAMEYRISFIFAILANLIDFSFGLLQYVVFFTAAKSIAGWQSDQILTLYSVFMFIFALHFIFLYPNLIEMAEMVNTGTLDLLLTKPVNTQIILSFKRISVEELGSLAASFALMIWLVYKGAISLTSAHLFQFLTAIIASMAIVYSLFVLLMSLSVKLEKMENLSQVLWSLFSFCRYPVEIYPGWLRHLFYSLFPLAFVATVPASAILGTATYRIVFTGLLIAAIAILMSRFFWKKCIRSYTSAGG